MNKPIEERYNPEHDYQLMLEKIREICKKKELSMYSLAKLTDMSPSSVSYIMRGETKPNILSLLTICNALGISMRDIIGNKEMEYTDEEQELVRIYRSLSVEKRKMLKVYIDMLEAYHGETN